MFTGKPDAVKAARPVWGGAVGKVPLGNSLAAYSTCFRATGLQTPLGSDP